MSEHTVKSYDAEIEMLRRKVIEMGSIAGRMVANSVDALGHFEEPLARSVVEVDSALDLQQREIEQQAIQMIARRQPMAIDLREMISAIRISGDIERIGDLAKNIASRALAIGVRSQQGRIVPDVALMTEFVLKQLKDVLDAFAHHNTLAAIDVWQRDGSVDAMYTSLFRELLTYMWEEPRTITLCTLLLFSAKDIERIGDHATNIAESVHYLVTGHTLPTDRPKEDRSISRTLEAIA